MEDLRSFKAPLKSWAESWLMQNITYSYTDPHLDDINI